MTFLMDSSIVGCENMSFIYDAYRRVDLVDIAKNQFDALRKTLDMLGLTDQRIALNTDPPTVNEVMLRLSLMIYRVRTQNMSIVCVAPPGECADDFTRNAKSKNDEKKDE